MSIQSRIRQQIQKSRTLVRDALQLGRLQWTERHHHPWRSLLLREQTQNTAAARILRMEKEWALLKYHGILPYLRQKKLLPYTSTTRAAPEGTHEPTRESETTTAKSHDTNPPDDVKVANVAKVAKIAFMITAQMKEELQSTLEYTLDDIKKMTPLQASLLLHHQIGPSQKEESLPPLEEQYHRQQEELARQLREEEIQRQQQQQQQEAVEKEEQEAERQRVKEAASPAGHVWFELVQHSESTNGDQVEQVVGLFQNQEEADIGKSVHETFAKRRSQSCVFDVRRVFRP